MRVTAILMILLGCAPEPEDPCADEDLPACPAECPDDWAADCGEPCDAGAEACGNDIGDGRTCLEGTWSCSVHPPLGGPGACNLVCRD